MAALSYGGPSPYYTGPACQRSSLACRGDTRFSKVYNKFVYQKRAQNRAAFYSVQVSGRSFLYSFLERVSPLLETSTTAGP